MTATEIVVDAEFHSLIPPLTNEERETLEDNLRRDGCLDPLIVWEGERLLLDGHNRKEICDRLGLGYASRELGLPDRDAAKRWIIEHQFGRRNLTPYQRAELALTLKPMLAAEADGRRKSGLGADGSGGRGRRRNHPQNSADGFEPMEGETRDEIARRAGVSHDTISKADFIQRHADDETKDRLRRGETSIHAEYTRLRQPHVAHNSGDSEWYTPSDYIERVVEVMGAIDLDPASCAVANRVVGAAKHLSAEDNGLACDWRGRVFLNPPYSQPLVGQFADKLVAHLQAGDVAEAIVLVNNATETRWFQTLLAAASAVCFPAGRVRFWHPEKTAAPLQGQAVLYLGEHGDRFVRAFANLGRVCDVRH